MPTSRSMAMTPPITPPTIVPLEMVDDPTLVNSLVAEFDAVPVFVVTVDIVVNPEVVDVSAEGHEFLPSSAITK